jgi:hypothetical protein
MALQNNPTYFAIIWESEMKDESHQFSKLEIFTTDASMMVR